MRMGLLRVRQHRALGARRADLLACVCFLAPPALFCPAEAVELSVSVLPGSDPAKPPSKIKCVTFLSVGWMWSFAVWIQYLPQTFGNKQINFYTMCSINCICLFSILDVLSQTYIMYTVHWLYGSRIDGNGNCNSLCGFLKVICWVLLVGHLEPTEHH